MKCGAVWKHQQEQKAGRQHEKRVAIDLFISDYLLGLGYFYLERKYMNRENIIYMAQEAGMDYLQHISPKAFEKVVIFAALVASAEREACAKDCESINSIEDFYGERPELICAKAIRARGQA